MTEEPQQAGIHHTSPIQTPKQLVAIVVLAFVIPIGAILLLSQLVTSGMRGADSHNPGAIAARIAPVGLVAVIDPNAPKVFQTGQQVFGSVCKTCHEAGLAGAPKVGDKAAWTARIAQGDATLYKHAIAGYQGKNGVMPAKGGNTDLADVEVQRAVVYMANQSGGNLKEPPAPANAAPAAATTTAAAGAAPASAAAVPVAVAAPAPAPAVAASPAATATAATAVAPAPTAVAPATAAAKTTVAAATLPAAPAAGAAKPDGKAVFASTCTVCHGAGIAGAPKFGDKAAWAARIAEGAPTLYQHAINGYQGKAGMMPPKGGNTSLSDDAVKAAVDYMMSAAK